MQFIEITLWGELSNVGQLKRCSYSSAFVGIDFQTLQSCQRTIVSQSKECKSLPETLFIHDCKHFSWTGCRQARLLIRPASSIKRQYVLHVQRFGTLKIRSEFKMMQRHWCVNIQYTFHWTGNDALLSNHGSLHLCLASRRLLVYLSRFMSFQGCHATTSRSKYAYLRA